jgi:succinate dehydrogenase/fumarate reductase cytochrome b subunit
VTTYSDFQLPSDLSQSEKYLLAAQWLKDGLSGRKIDFPQSSFELRCFKFARSRSTLAVFSIACFIHLTLPFLYPQMCPYEMATSGVLVDFRSRLFDNYPTVETLMAIEFLICIVYAIELGSRLLVNNLENIKAKRFRYDPKNNWITVRLVCVSAVFVELIYAFVEPSYRK